MSTTESAKKYTRFLPEGYRKHNVFVSRVKAPAHVNVSSYWSGGSKSYFVLYPGGTLAVQSVGKDPGFPAKPTPLLDLVAGDVLVESGTFCGKTATAKITFVE